MLKLLKANKNFRYLWIGQLISALGDRLTQMGILTFVMLKTADKGDKMAIITFFSLLPFLLFGPLFGALTDKGSRKGIMLSADFLRAFLVALIPFIWISTHSVIFIVAWIFLLGSLTALFAPAKMSIITNIVEKGSLLEANSLVATTGMVATLIGTSIAGALINLTGVAPSFYINSFTYIVSALFILKIAYKRPEGSPRISERPYHTLLSDIKTGLSYIKRHKLLMSLMALSGAFSFITSFSYILTLNYGSVVLKQGPLGMGFLLSGAGFGMIVGSLILIKRKDRVNYKRALYLSYLLIGLFTLSFISQPSFYLSLAVLFFAGIGAAILEIALDTIFQRVTPDELRGKIFAARGVLGNSVFLSSLLLVGFLIKYIPASSLFGLLGVVAIGISLWVFFYQRHWGYQLLRGVFMVPMKALFSLKVSGLENIKTKGVILAGNHTSVLDGIALGCAYPKRIYFLSLETLFRAPFWGWWARLLGYIPVKRKGLNKEAIRQAVDLLQSGQSIGIFPEGKITQDGNLSEGKEGVAMIARLAGASVIPFAIEGAYEAWPSLKKPLKRFPIEVKFGKPIDIKSYPAKDALTEELMQEIARLKLSLEREGYLRVEPDEIVRHLINVG